MLPRKCAELQVRQEARVHQAQQVLPEQRKEAQQVLQDSLLLDQLEVRRALTIVRISEAAPTAALQAALAPKVQPVLSMQVQQAVQAAALEQRQRRQPMQQPWQCVDRMQVMGPDMAVDLWETARPACILP